MSVPPPLPAANPYAAPIARVEDAPSDGLVLAGRGTRLLAAIVDSLIVLVPFYLLMFSVPSLFLGSSPELAAGGFATGAGAVALMVAGIGFMIAVIWINCTLLHRYGQTIAKRMFGIRIVRNDGAPVTLGRVIVARWLPMAAIGLIPLIGPIVQIVDSLMIFRADHRCLHDLIADTVVVNA